MNIRQRAVESRVGGGMQGGEALGGRVGGGLGDGGGVGSGGTNVNCSACQAENKMSRVITQIRPLVVPALCDTVLMSMSSYLK